MTSKIRIGIAGYGNLGRGVQSAIAKNPDMELVGVYTRRDPGTLDLAQPAPRFAMDELEQHAGGIDVLILCGGSRSDLPEQGPKFAALFNTVDSFDTHARIPEYFQSVDAPAKAAGKTALISVGWDPGMFSINRVFGEALLPDGQTYTFWGRGLSQGHSDAIRRVPGVAAGVQYTIPSQEAIDRVRAGQRPSLSTREKHQRECFVVLEDGADAQAVREAIVGMEHYFDQYDTTVEFIDEQTLAAEHSNMPHGGFVIRSGNTS
ncbi:MAG: diaminopimelate dehydrogenase, partial [Glutamicibacter arilaitensis]